MDGSRGSAEAAFSLDRNRIKEPKKTRDVNPIYPESARRAREQGVVILEAVIGERGCISAILN